MRNLLFVVVAFLASYTVANAQFLQVEIEDLAGKKMSFEQVLKPDVDYNVLVFWATWCSPCKKQIESYAEMIEDWQTEFNMEVVLVSIDNARAKSKVKPMVKAKDWPFVCYIDPSNELVRAFNSVSVPYTVVLNKKNEIVWVKSGYLPGDEDVLYEKLTELQENKK